MALSAACKILGADTVPALVQPVVDLLSHSRELVRKKAVVCLHNFYLKCPSAVEPHVNVFHRMLCDKDPSVMCVSVLALGTLVNESPDEYKRLVPSLINLLKQILDGRLPKSYLYHRSSAPFIQLHLLRVLGPLGRNDQSTSEQMYSVLGETLRLADNNSNIGIALVYEAASVVATIYPQQQLLERSASIVSRFLQSKTSNVRYIGVKAVSKIVKASPQAAMDHQMAVIDCLDDPDESLRKAALDLLYKLTKANNVELVVARMMDYVRSTSSKQSQEDTVQKVVELAERYAPSTHWFITTMNDVFKQAGSYVRPQVAHSVMELLQEGTGESDEADTGLRASAVQSYMELLQQKHLPVVLHELIAWTIGEFGVLYTKEQPHELMNVLRNIGERANDKNVDGYVVSALGKVIAASGVEPPGAVVVYLRQLAQGSDSVIRQRAAEVEELRSMGIRALKDVTPPTCTEPAQSYNAVNLDFLDGYIQQYGVLKALPKPNGANEASQSSVRERGAHPKARMLRFEPYGQESASNASNAGVASGISSSSFAHARSEDLQAHEETLTRGNKRWGAESHMSRERTNTPSATADDAQPDKQQEQPVGNLLDAESTENRGMSAESTLTEADRLAQELESARPLPTQGINNEKQQQQEQQQFFQGSSYTEASVNRGADELNLDALYSGYWKSAPSVQEPKRNDKQAQQPNDPLEQDRALGKE